VQGFRRRFSLNDENIQYPYTVNERVPNWLLLVLAFGAPFCLMPFINVISVRSLWDLHNSELGRKLAPLSYLFQHTKITSHVLGVLAWNRLYSRALSGFDRQYNEHLEGHHRSSQT
jgi:hypothetical protein